MSLSAFVPTNTQKARTTAISAFKRMPELEGVSMEFLHASILNDSSGKRLAAAMDRFGYYLATHEGKNGKLARNTASSYYRNVKLWLFDSYPHLRVATELILLKQGKTLDKHCLKRENGGLTNKAPPCTKEDLKNLVRYVYSTARVNSDYQDAALACLMWHCFGRSSDLGFVQKQHVSVSADGVFYLRMLRVKTAEEQGLTLVPDKADFLTCPLHALAVALVTQEAPCASLLGHLPALAPQTADSLDAGAPLHGLLSADPATLRVAVVSIATSTTAATSSTDAVVTLASTPTHAGAQPTATRTTTQKKDPKGGGVTRGEDSMQSHVNRMLKRVAEPAGVAADLTSHSFRRGGAQHANGDDSLAAQWIFDRGAWDMTKTSKAFAYITNTAREDRKVAHVLSGWDVDAAPTVVDIADQDHATRERLGLLQEHLFSTCTVLKEQRLNVSTKALSVLTAYLVRYFPQFKTLAPEAPIVTRVEECMVAADISTADLLAWSMALSEEAAPPVQEAKEIEEKTHTCRDHEHLLAVIEELIASNKVMSERLTIIEAAALSTQGAKPKGNSEQMYNTSDQDPKPKRRKKHTTNLSAAWYKWYTKVPPVWDSVDRQKKSESRHIVAFMKLFLVEGFTLDPRAEDYRDQVLDTDRQAENALLTFLRARGTNAKGAGNVLRSLRPLHKSGALNEYILAYKCILAIGVIVDPAPADTQDILSIVENL